MTSTPYNIFPRILPISSQNNFQPSSLEISTTPHPSHYHPEEPKKLPKDPLLATIYSKSPLGPHLLILEKVQAALIRGSKIDAMQFLKSNVLPLPQLPNITEKQATIILENLSKKMCALIQKPHLSIEFTPLEFFLYLLKETSKSDNKLPQILDIECIGSHALTLLPEITDQIFQTLLGDSFHPLNPDVFKPIEEKRGHLEYRIKIPSSTLQSFDNYSQLFAAFLCEKAKRQPVEISASMIERFVKKHWFTPTLFYEDCHASISVSNLEDQSPCTFIISQRPKESNLFKNTLNVSVKWIIEKVKDLSLDKEELSKEELQEMLLESMKTEKTLPIVLRNDAKAFWKTQFDRLPPFTDSIDDITDTLATVELWLACVNRLTKRLHINEPIAPHILYGGWLENIWEILHGNRLANDLYEKRLLDASFQSLNNLLHPEEIQKQLDSCLTSKQWERVASYLLKKIAGNDFNLSIAMLVQSSLVLLRNGYDKHIKDLWLALFPRLNTIRPSKDSPPTLWTHIYDCIKENRDSFKAIAAILEIKAFLLLCNKPVPNKSPIQALNCPFEASPAFRLSDGTYSLHLSTHPEETWKNLYQQLTSIKTTKSLEALCQFIDSAKFDFNPELNLDFISTIPCIEQFITKKIPESTCWYNLALEGLLACYMQTDKDSWQATKKTLNHFQFTNSQEHVFIKNHMGKYVEKKFFNKEIPTQLLCALALTSNITPQTYQSDILQAFNLWSSYNQIEPKQFSKYEQELLLKIAPYRPDLATNMLKVLLDKNLLSIKSFYPFIKEYSASIATTLKTTPWKDDLKLHVSLQKISETLLEAIDINPSNIPLLLEAIQLAIYSNHLLIGTQTAAAIIKLECSDQYNNSLEYFLLQILKKIAPNDQNLLYEILKQITHSPKLQQLIDQAPEKFFPVLSELSNHLLIADDTQRQVACNFFRILIQLCDKAGQDIRNNYHCVLPLANQCLSQAPSPKSAFYKCLWMFQKPLQEAISELAEKNVNLNAFFQRSASTSSSNLMLSTEDAITLSESEVLLLLEKIDLKLILQEIVKDSEHLVSTENRLQAFIETLGKLRPQLPIQKILGLLLHFFDATFSLVKDKESKQSIKIAVKLWNTLEGIFHQAEREQENPLITQEQLSHYSKLFANNKILLNGLVDSSDVFNASLKSIKSIVENCDIFSLDLIFNDNSLKYLPLLPKKRDLVYLENLLEHCMPLLIKLLKQQKSDPLATRTPYKLLTAISQTSYINKFSVFIHKLREINTPLAAGCALCLAHGLLLSARKLPLKIKQQIISLLENTPWEATNYLLLCLASQKELISSEKRISLLEKALEKIENSFSPSPYWTTRYAGLCRAYLDTWLYKKDYSPITHEAADKIIQRLSYLSVFESSFPFKNCEKTITALKANCDHLKTAFPLNPGELELYLLNNILSQPVKNSVLFYQQLTNSFSFLESISKDVLFNYDGLHKEIYTLAIMGVSDSCLSDSSVYNLYQETISKLYALLQTQYPSSSSDILTLISNSKSDHLYPQCAKTAFQLYLRDIKRTYQNSKYQKLREGVMQCKRLMFIVNKGIEETLFQEDACSLLFEIAEFIGDVAFDYHSSKQFFSTIHLMAMQVINLPLLKNHDPVKRLEILIQWSSRLITCKSESALKAVEKLLTEIFSDFFILFNRKTIHCPNALKETIFLLKRFQQLLFSLPNTKYPEIECENLFNFSLEVFPDSSFMGGPCCKEEYSLLNQSIKDLLSEAHKKTTPFPWVLTLLFINSTFNNEEKNSALYEVRSYLEKIKTDYIPGKNGYMCFKRVFSLLFNCQMKGIFEGHYNEYLEMVAFLTDITVNSPEKNFLEEMKVSITLLLNLNTRNLSEEEQQLQKKAIVIWNKRLEQLRDSFNC